MTGVTRKTTDGVWRGWSREHRQGLSVAGHVILFALGWVLAFCLAYNFSQSMLLLRRSDVDTKAEITKKGARAALTLVDGLNGVTGLRIDWWRANIRADGQIYLKVSPCSGVVVLNPEARKKENEVKAAMNEIRRIGGRPVLLPDETDEPGQNISLAVLGDGVDPRWASKLDALRLAGIERVTPRSGAYVLEAFKEPTHETRVACTAPYEAPGLQKLIGDRDSGVGGTVRVLELGAGEFTVQYVFYDWFTMFCLPLLVPAVVIKLVTFVLMGLHRASWRYVSLRDVFSVMRAAWVSFFGIFILYYGLQNARLIGLQIDVLGKRFPDSVFVLDFAGTVALICGARLAIRLYYEEKRPAAAGVTPKLLVIGAGNAGENIVRETQRMPVERYRVVGFLDDDRAKLGARIHGVEVLGPIDEVTSICKQYGVDEILIAVPSATRERLRKVVELCQGTNLRFKTVPALSDLIAGRASVKEIRDVDINDLLGRAPVTLDAEQIGRFLCERVVLVTGAGGSIGAELCRQIARFAPRRLVLVERAEPNLFLIDQELRRSFPQIDVVPCIADIGDQGRMDCICRSERPSAIFHAAAHKHVPMMEHNPGEALKNNIRGTRMLADAADRFGCEKFVMISTDKAVNPTSVMGCSKRVAEMYIQGLSTRSKTQFVTVRFGNVLGSSGSVIPIFREQIARGGPVTVTHPEMVRYFMTIPEASQLVLQAASMGQGGEIFVLDMGEQVKIVDLAREMITLSGFRPDVDIKIAFSGMRPGEKLYEELAIEGEGVSRTAHPKIGISQNIPVDWNWLVQAIDGLVAEADGLTREAARQRLKEIVPEFHLETPPPRPVEAEINGPVAGVEAKVAPVGGSS